MILLLFCKSLCAGCDLLSPSSVHPSCSEKVLLTRGLIVLASSFYNFRKLPSPLKSTPLITTILYTCEWQPHSPATPDGLVATSEPRESAAGGRSIEGAPIISNHLPGREAWHIFITVAMKTISDYHQDIKLATTQNDWLLNVMVLWATAGDGKNKQKEKREEKKKSSLFLSWFIKLPQLCAQVWILIIFMSSSVEVK